MFTNERLFTIQAFTITRVHCIKTKTNCSLMSLNINIPSKKHHLSNDADSAHLIINLHENHNMESRHSKKMILGAMNKNRQRYFSNEVFFIDFFSSGPWLLW